MIFSCLFQNCLSVMELNYLLVFSLFLLICSVIFSACGGPARGRGFGVIFVYLFV